MTPSWAMWRSRSGPGGAPPAPPPVAPPGLEQVRRREVAVKGEGVGLIPGLPQPLDRRAEGVRVDDGGDRGPIEVREVPDLVGHAPARAGGRQAPLLVGQARDDCVERLLLGAQVAGHLGERGTVAHWRALRAAPMSDRRFAASNALCP